MHEKFSKQIEECKNILNKRNTAFNLVGYAKLLLVLLLGVSLYFMVTKTFPISLIIGSEIILIVLIVLWSYHDRLYEDINYLNGIIAINRRNLDRLSGDWVHFPDIGKEFIDAEHPYACDLDIVGEKSLFQFMNTTRTWFGRQALAGDLLNSCYSIRELKKRQDAILELSKDFGFSKMLEYHFSKIKPDDSVLKLVNELKDSRKFVKTKITGYFLSFLPLLPILSFACGYLIGLAFLYSVGIGLLGLQLIIWVCGLPKILKYLGTAAQMPYKLSLYSKVLDVLQDRKFDCEKLCQIQAELGNSELSAAQALKDLSKISDRINVRHNGIMCVILNALFLWDYQCALMLEEWKEKYAHAVEKWFLTLGEFESLLCFSKMTGFYDNTCMPVFTEKSKTFAARDMGHPLLHNEKRVNNDIRLSDSIIIISGSNMSGKTTFLRTVGINIVLAQAGGYVCAGEMTLSPMKIMTSMRVTDDLSEGVSTFYAELKRIKGIIDLAKTEKNTIFLIDEIFRGTNSSDRLSGAKTVISKLNELGVIGMITTHDLTLCDLANKYLRILNYSFSEHYKDKKICFDYILKPGKSNTTNAKFLMEMIGIIE